MRDFMYRLGKHDARDLRARAQGMTGTQIIEEEAKVPKFADGQDYSDWPRGAPVRDDGQVWQLLQPYDSKAHPGRPAELRALWGLCHTTNPARAKPWVDALGTSGMYMRGECYRDEAGVVHRAKKDNLVHNAEAAPKLWEVVTA